MERISTDSTDFWWFWADEPGVVTGRLQRLTSQQQPQRPAFDYATKVKKPLQGQRLPKHLARKSAQSLPVPAPTWPGTLATRLMTSFVKSRSA